jgi:hypothetical protein
MYHEYPWNLPLLVLAPILGLTTAVLVHLLLAWLTGGAQAYRCVLRGFMCGALATLGISVYALLWISQRASVMRVKGYNFPMITLEHQDLPLITNLVYLVFNLLIFAALGFCYINFVGLSIASLRIRILQELLAHPEGLSQEKILESYNPRVLIDNRIDRLTAGLQLVEKDGRYHTGRRGILWAARIMNFTKRFVLGKKRRSST